MKADIDDVKFISRLIDQLIADYKIDPKRIYASGHSNGGMLCYRLACELSTKIAAIAVNSCSMVTTQPCHPARPMPILHIHSKLDKRVPYVGGPGITGIDYLPLEEVFNLWAAIDHCAQPAQVVANDGYTLKKWTSDTHNASIVYYLTNDGGHGWPGGMRGGPISDTPSTAINANDLLWDFFRQYQLP